MREEAFLPIEGHPGYFVSNMGRFRKGNTKILSTFKRRNGYIGIAISQDGIRKYYSAHRIVAGHFIGRLDADTEVNHKNFDKEDNRVENLEIVSHRENMQHYHSDERAKGAYKKISVTKKMPVDNLPDLTKQSYTLDEAVAIHFAHKDRIQSEASTYNRFKSGKLGNDAKIELLEKHGWQIEFSITAPEIESPIFKEGIKPAQ